MSFFSAPGPDPMCPAPVKAAIDEVAHRGDNVPTDAVTISLAQSLLPREFVACRQLAESANLAIVITGSRAVIRERTPDTIALEGEVEFFMMWTELRGRIRRFIAWWRLPRLRRMLSLRLHQT